MEDDRSLHLFIQRQLTLPAIDLSQGKIITQPLRSNLANGKQLATRKTRYTTSNMQGITPSFHDVMARLAIELLTTRG